MSGEALGRRLVACKGFRWMPGMLGSEGFRAVVQGRPGVAFWRLDLTGVVEEYVPSVGDGGVLPDTDDPATLGCVLALVREKLGNAHVVDNAGEWFVYTWRDGYRWIVARGASEAVVLIGALGAGLDAGVRAHEALMENRRTYFSRKS